MKSTTFDEIYASHRKVIVAAVCYYGVPARYAEEVAHDVLIAVLGALPTYDASRPLRPWLMAITYRIAHDWRELNDRRSHLSDGDEQADVTDAAPGPDEHAIAREGQRVLEDLLRGLDEIDRVVWIAVELDERTQADVVQEVCMPESTVQYRLRRARIEVDAAIGRMRAAEVIPMRRSRTRRKRRNDPGPGAIACELWRCA